MSIASFWKKSTTNTLILTSTFLWITLAVISIFFDLSISKGLYSPNAFLPGLVEKFGEIPGALVGIFALFILGTNWEIKDKKLKGTIFLGEVAVSTFSIIFIFNLVVKALRINFNYFSPLGVLIGLGALLISLLGFYIFETKFKNFSKRHFFFGKVTSIAFIVSGLFAEIAKNLWGRVRFENLAQNFSNFTPWYLPQGFTGSHSFPSGHAYLAAMTFSLVLLVSEKDNLKRWIVGALAAVFTVFVSYERIIGGFHYLSDVVFSAFFTILALLVVYKLNLDAKKPSEKPNLSTTKYKKELKKR